MFPSFFPTVCFFTASAALIAIATKMRHLVRGKKQPPYRSDANWSRAYATVAVVLGIWTCLWSYEGGIISCLICTATIVAGGMLSLWRRCFVAATVSSLRKGGLRLLRVVAIAAAAATATISLEVSWNAAFPSVDLHALLIEYALVLLSLTVLYFLSAGHGVGPAAGVGLFCTIGIIQAFVLDFKGSVLSTGDLFALKTAMAVSGGYEYHLGDTMLDGISWATAGGAICALLYGPSQEEKPATQHNLTSQHRRSSLLLGIAALAALLCGIVVPNYERDLGIDINYWPDQQVLTHQQEGLLPSFIAEAQGLPIEEPEGYSDEAAEEAQQDLIARYEQSVDSTKAEEAQSQWSQTKPSIIVVMNETFTDLSYFGGLDSYSGPTFFNNGLSDALFRGKLAVSFNGGGTCNTEFEFLCGESMAFIGYGKYPYTLYDFSGIDTLPRQLAAAGYQTTAMHPNLASNWDRDRVYKEMGFQNFLSIDSFSGAQQIHNATADSATYDAIIEQLSTNEEPQFIFDVTMQNHGDYNQGDVDQSTLSSYLSAATGLVDDKTSASIAEYLTCIDESDRELETFVSELKQLQRPVLLVFFGDHQPYFTHTLNDALESNEDTTTHEERLYQSDYVVWANYDVAANDQDGTQLDASASDLAAHALAAIGSPLTDHQKATLGAATLYSQLNLYGYRGLDGSWHQMGDDSDADAASGVKELQMVFYRSFGLRV